MSDSTTPSLGLVKPTYGGDAETWGTKWNSNADLIDGLGAFSISEVEALWQAIATLQSDIAAAASPGEAIGTVKWWPMGGGFPPGFVPCDGLWLTVSQYPALFAVLGYGWGGDGAANFAVPDLRGCVLVNFDFGSGRLAGQYGPDAIGAIGGAALVALNAAQVPPHAHGGGTDSQGAHLHNVPTPTPSAVSPGGYPVTIGPVGFQGSVTDVQGFHVHNIVTDVQGGGGAHTNVQPGALGWFIIRVV